MRSKKAAKNERSSARGKRLVGGKKMNEVKPLATNAYIQLTDSKGDPPPPPPKG